MKKTKAIAIALSTLLLFTSCETRKTLEWPTSGLSAVLPVPNAKKGEISFDYNTAFSAEINFSSTSEFEEYKNMCKEKGFTVEASESNDSYNAYNSEGYELSLRIATYDDIFFIDLHPPKERENIIWPTLGLSLLIPKPNSTTGKITVDSSSQFYAYICDVSLNDYHSYIEKCIANGFNIDYNKGEEYYSAKDENGNKIHIAYEGFNTISISIHEADKSDNQPTVDSTTESPEITTPVASITEPQPTESSSIENSTPSNGIRPEVKDALDSYEALMNEYCTFMEKYNASPNDMTLLLEYTEYLSKYTDAMDKLNKLDNTEFNDEELKYYIKITNRVNERLLDVA